MRIFAFHSVLYRLWWLGVLSALCSAVPAGHLAAQLRKEPDRRAPERIVIAGLAAPATLNPFVATDASSLEIHGFIYESLLRLDDTTLQYVPLLADSLPRHSMDRRTLEFKLNPAARFSDGWRVTPADVIFSVKASKHWGVQLGQVLHVLLANVERADRVVDDSLRVRFTLRAPNVVTERALEDLWIFPKHVWDPAGVSDRVSWEDLASDSTTTPALDRLARLLQTEDAQLAPLLIGSGPYVLERTMGPTGEIALTKSRTYWNAGSAYGIVHARHLVWRYESDPDRMIDLLRSGKADVIPFVNALWYVKAKTILQHSGIAALPYRHPSYTYLGFNMARAMFRERNVRRAVSHAVDRATIISEACKGYAELVDSPVLRERPEYNTTLAPITFDLDSSRALLATAGWSDGDGDGVRDKMIDGHRTALSFHILVNAGNEMRLRMAEIIRESLRGIGVRAEVEILDWAEFLQRMRDREYDAIIGGWSVNTSETSMRQIWHSASISSGGSNYGAFSNREVDSLIDAWEAAGNVSERAQMCRRIQQIVADEAPFCFLVRPTAIALYRDVFENVTVMPLRQPIAPQYWLLKSTTRGEK